MSVQGCSEKKKLKNPTSICEGNSVNDKEII